MFATFRALRGASRYQRGSFDAQIIQHSVFLRVWTRVQKASGVGVVVTPEQIAAAVKVRNSYRPRMYAMSKACWMHLQRELRIASACAERSLGLRRRSQWWRGTRSVCSRSATARARALCSPSCASSSPGLTASSSRRVRSPSAGPFSARAASRPSRERDGDSPRSRRLRLSERAGRARQADRGAPRPEDGGGQQTSGEEEGPQGASAPVCSCLRHCSSAGAQAPATASRVRFARLTLGSL